MISLREEEAALAEAAAAVYARIEREAAAAATYQVRDLLNHLRRELFSVELSVAGWMKACRLSATAGSRLFEAALGVSPESFLWDCRLETGAGLLIDTELAVGEIGRIVCFARRDRFEGGFMGWSGLSPEVFRREIRRFPGHLMRSGESLLSRELLESLVACRLSEEAVTELIDRLWTINLAYWSTRMPREALEALFAEELWEERLSENATECERALFQLCFSTPVLDELLREKLAASAAEKELDVAA